MSWSQGKRDRDGSYNSNSHGGGGQKWYAVVDGPGRGVYGSWKECERAKGSSWCKGHPSRAEAEDWLRQQRPGGSWSGGAGGSGGGGVTGASNPGSPSGGKFYAVPKGKKPGVYCSWPATEEASQGGWCRKFSTFADAVAYMNEKGAQNKWDGKLTSASASFSGLSSRTDSGGAATTKALQIPDGPRGGMHNRPTSDDPLPSAEFVVLSDAGADEGTADKPMEVGEPVYTLTADQQRIFDMVVHEGKNVFITGNAGTGKSVVVKQIIKALREKEERGNTNWNPSALSNPLLHLASGHPNVKDPPHVQNALKAADNHGKAVEQVERAVAVTASTGVAALPLGGTTLHSWSSYTIDKAMEEVTPEERDEARFGRVRAERNAVKYRECKTLIIDEISMVDAELFKFIDSAAKQLRSNAAIQGLENRVAHENDTFNADTGRMESATVGNLDGIQNLNVDARDLPFGGIQFVVAGDFLQLPPVVANMKGLGGDENTKKFGVKVREHLFDSMTWRAGHFTEYCLTETLRQDSKDQATFIDALSLARMGANRMSPHHHALFAPKPNRVVETDAEGNDTAVQFRTKIKTVDNINDVNYSRVLENLKQKDPNSSQYERWYFRLNDTRHPLEDTGERGYTKERAEKCRKALDDIIKGSRAESDMRLCVGARVMLLANLDLDRGLVNGSCGTIEAFVASTRSTRPENVDTGHFGTVFPRVRFDAAGPHTARSETIFPWLCGMGETGSSQGPDGGQEMKKHLASTIQIPLLKCWAITVHKAQGITVERMEVDLNPWDIFEDGQGYVAVSRCRSIQGLSVLNYPSAPDHLRKVFRADQRSVKYYDELAAWKQNRQATTVPCSSTVAQRKAKLTFPVYKAARLLISISIGQLRSLNFEDASMCLPGTSIPRPDHAKDFTPYESTLYGCGDEFGPLRLESSSIRRHIWSILKRLEFATVEGRSATLARTWTECVALHSNFLDSAQQLSRIQSKVLTEPFCALEILLNLFEDRPLGAVAGADHLLQLASTIPPIPFAVATTDEQINFSRHRDTIASVTTNYAHAAVLTTAVQFPILKIARLMTCIKGGQLRATMFNNQQELSPEDYYTPIEQLVVDFFVKELKQQNSLNDVSRLITHLDQAPNLDPLISGLWREHDLLPQDDRLRVFQDIFRQLVAQPAFSDTAAMLPSNVWDPFALQVYSEL